MNKQKVLKAYIDFLDDKIEKTQGSLESIQKIINDAPTPSESHSDTTRFQQSQLASDTLCRLASLRQTRTLAASIPCESLDCPVAGALVVIQDKRSGEKECYFIIPGQGGGESLSVDGLEIIPISFKAPILAPISGIRVGDTFKFRGRELILLEIS